METWVFDIDGVLADFEGSFVENFGAENREWVDLIKRYPSLDDIIDPFIQDPDTYADLNPIFGGILLLHQALERGFQVVIMTSRPRSSWRVTEEWLVKYRIQYNEIIFTSDKTGAITNYNQTHQDKVVVLVDDLRPNVETLPKGVRGLLWEQPWNSNINLTQNNPLVRYNWDTFQVEVKTDIMSTWKPFWR
jgi:phosphoglycolate phosphatase-like HAD superfamily hydrolase